MEVEHARRSLAGALGARESRQNCPIIVKLAKCFQHSTWIWRPTGESCYSIYAALGRLMGTQSRIHSLVGNSHSLQYSSISLGLTIDSQAAISQLSQELSPPGTEDGWLHVPSLSTVPLANCWNHYSSSRS